MAFKKVSTKVLNELVFSTSTKSDIMAFYWSGAFKCVYTMPGKKDISSGLREGGIASQDGRGQGREENSATSSD